MSDTMGVNSSGFILNHTTTTNGEWKTLLKTENKFVDKDIGITITTPAASQPVLAAEDINSSLSMGNASNGIYSPTVTITGAVNIENAGWISNGNHNVSDSGVKVGTVNQSTLKNGNTTIASGSTVTPAASTQTINISEGYNAARTLIIDSVDNGPVAEVTSGSAAISSITYTYDSTNSRYNVSGSANVSAPTVITAGYISNSKGAKISNSGGAILSAIVDKIGIAANLSGTGTYAPTINKNAATNINIAGTATTSQPSSGYYVAVSSNANTGTVSATASVTSAGYGTTTSGQYTTTPSSALTVGAAASSITYIPLTQTTFANVSTSGVTYTDISSSAPALISGDFLYINEGYTPNVKISLARLVPDATGVNASSAYILNGYTAYNNNGALIVGSIQTYTGAYEVV